eukprot:CAMPEP_0115054716 /NCGR_PEP_ID=MMETSP0227-20121206/4247_1 /TAXON_ID=89957 /ORGANISM="Polarella glacialis, Strain CCMP 1383" /LENGTH=47 /DNA_ID= /DNA_START= /DNA_END= /DNA_ORIENTATION=
MSTSSASSSPPSGELRAKAHLITSLARQTQNPSELGMYMPASPTRSP